MLAFPEGGDAFSFVAPDRPSAIKKLDHPGEVRLKADPRGHFVFEGQVDGTR